jgi:hypothetical protein
MKIIAEENPLTEGQTKVKGKELVFFFNLREE